MKKLFTLITLIVLTINANAQRHCNLVITAASLKDTAFVDTAAVQFSVRIKNMGPDSLKASDSIAMFLISWDPYTHSLNSPNTFAFITNHPMQVGDSVAILDSPANLNLFKWQNWPADSIHSICLYVTGWNRSADSVAADTATQSEVCGAFRYLDLHKVAISKDGIKIYPNPAQSELNFNIDLNKSGNLSVQMLDMLGRIVLNQDEGFKNAGSQKISINTSGLSNGIYIYRVMVDAETTTGRFSIIK